MKVPSLKLDLGHIDLGRSIGRRSGGGDVVGLDIQPGLVAAVQARANGSILAQRASALPLAGDTVREGEVFDTDALAETLRELFHGSGLSKRVRVGVANQRTVMRTLELPPVTDRKELAAAVRFQAQDQVPMPLNNAVLDFHPLGVVDTPAGPRQRVVLVAAQRDMIERLLAAVQQAGLHPEGIDLSAFALIRSLYHSDSEHAGRVLYLNVDGLSNLAIAEGTICRFTRVVGGGLEAMAGELAERRGITLTDARALLAAFDLTAPATVPMPTTVPDVPSPPTELETAPPGASEDEIRAELDAPVAETDAEDAPSVTVDHDAVAADHNAREDAMSYAEMSAAPPAPSEEAPVEQAVAERSDKDVQIVLESGIREIASEVRNSLDFHGSQEGGGQVSRVVLSGSVLDIPGFSESLQASLGLEVHSQAVGLADERLEGTVSTHRLAIATGLAASEVHQ